MVQDYQPTVEQMVATALLNAIAAEHERGCTCRPVIHAHIDELRDDIRVAVWHDDGCPASDPAGLLRWG